MIVGFVGSQKGMTKEQRQAFLAVVKHLQVSTLHHGDCIGADEQVHRLIRKQTLAKLIVHPPACDEHRAFCEQQTFTYLPVPYLERNHNIVNRCQHLVAAPSTQTATKAGTWEAIGYARKIKRPVTIVHPDGSVRHIAGSNADSLHELRKRS